MSAPNTKEGAAALKNIQVKTEGYNAPGYFVAVRTETTVDVPPDPLFRMLSKRLPVLMPSSMVDVEDVVLAGPEKGRQLIKRAFYVPWKFMLLGGRQRVVADVQHDWPALTLDTRLAEKGFYAGLHTTYSLAPEVPGQSRQSGRTRLTLDFRVTPSVLPPPPFKFVLKNEIKKMVAHSLREVSARAGSTWEEQRRQQQAQRPLLLLAVAPLSAFNVPALAQHARQHLDAAMRLLLTAEPPAAILA